MRRDARQTVLLTTAKQARSFNPEIAKARVQRFLFS
jgi:hypothetical protein